MQDLDPAKLYQKKNSQQSKVKKETIQPNSLLEHIKSEVNKDQAKIKPLSKSINCKDAVIKKGVLEKRKTTPKHYRIPVNDPKPEQDGPET